MVHPQSPVAQLKVSWGVSQACTSPATDRCEPCACPAPPRHAGSPTTSSGPGGAVGGAEIVTAISFTVGYYRVVCRLWHDVNPRQYRHISSREDLVHARRVAGLVLCGLGAALIVLAPLLHWWVGPALTKSPIGGETVSDASGENVTYLDFTNAAKGPQVGTVRSREVYHGIADDSTDTVAVYTLDAETYYTAEPVLARDITARQERFAVDRKTALAVPDPKGQEQVDKDVNNSAAKHSGLILKFPIDTQKKSYPFWDAQLRSSQYPMEYRGEDTVDGLKVYQFEQNIPDTDLSAETPNLHYSSVRRVWVEPATGVIVKGQQTVSATLGAPTDPDKLTVLNGTLTFTDENIKAMAKKARDATAKIDMIQLWAPLVFLLLGLISLVAGLLLVRGGDSGGKRAAHRLPGPPEGTPSDEPTITFPSSRG
jgi:hypothetical protein